MARPDRDLSALSRLDPRRRAALIELAESRSRHPVDLLDDAVDAVLDLDAWHRSEIEAGKKDAEAGDFATADEVAEAFRPFPADGRSTAVLASGAKQPRCATPTEVARP